MFELDPASLLTSQEALAARYGQPSARALDKVANALDATHRDWLKDCGFVVLASAGQNTLDCSPRGDAPGELFHIVDERTLLLPDRLGNHRIDTLTRLMSDPRIGLLFLVRGEERVLRVRGRAELTVQTDVLERFMLDGVSPASVLVVRIEAVLMQNARAVRRARLWNSD